MMTDVSSLIVSGQHTYYREAGPSAHEIAICLVTVLKIDKSYCNYEKGVHLPVVLHIDEIIDGNPAFALKAGDTVTVADQSAWIKDEKGFDVSTMDGSVPITEEGMRYVLSIEEILKESTSKDYYHGLNYVTYAFTIPFDLTGYADRELYEKMKLPDDVIACSEELIKYFSK